MTHKQINAFIAIDEGVRAEAVEAVLPVDPNIHVVGPVEGLEESWKTLQDSTADVLVLACAGHSERALFLIEGSIRQQPGRAVVVLCEGSPNGFVRRVFESGADEIVTLPGSREELRFALQKAMARRQGKSTTSGVASAPLVCVLGPKGGTGKTLTSVNLGVGLAAEGKRVVIVDLDLQFGDVGLSLGLTPENTIYDLAKSGGSLDAEKLEAYLATHSSGVRVLLAPRRPDQASAVTVEFLRELYATLRSSNDYVVVDTPPGFTPEVIASIDSSTDVVMVGMLDTLSLKNTKLGLETLELMGYEPNRIRLVLNRAGSKVGITSDDVVAVVGRPPDVLVPSDREIPRAVNEGNPIVLAKRGSEAAKAFRELAGAYISSKPAQSDAGPPQKHRSGLRRLLARGA